MTDPIPASITAQAKLWRVDSGEHEIIPDSLSWSIIWQPLDVRLGPDAKPSCFLGDKIVFYDRSGNKLLHDLVQHYDFMGLHPHLLFVAGKWREVVGGRCEYHKGSWAMRWSLSTGTHWAGILNGDDGGPA